MSARHQEAARRGALHYAIKAADVAEDGTFSGYASLFGDVDSYGDITVPGAFTKSLKTRFGGDAIMRPRLLWQHDPNEPIGTWLEMREDGKGLFAKGRLVLEVQRAREAYALLKAGEVLGLSIGYEATGIEYRNPDEVERKWGFAIGDVGQVRALTEVDLWETSLVTFPALATAGVDEVKAGAAAPLPDLVPIAAALARRRTAFL